MAFSTYNAQRRNGDFRAALGSIKRVFEIDPLSAQYACEVGNAYEFLREYADAERYYNMAIARDPNRPFSYAMKAQFYLLKGDLGEARRAMEKGLKKIDPTGGELETSWPIWLMATIDTWDGRYRDALTRLSEGPAVRENSLWRAHHAILKAEIHTHLGNTDQARQCYESARDFLLSKVAEYPDVAEYRSVLGRAYAGLGDKEKAIEYGERGRDLLPVNVDHVGGARRVEDLARIYAMVGDYESAIRQLEYLLSIPSKMSRQLLQLDPVWDPLRDHARFKTLTESGK